MGTVEEQNDYRIEINLYEVTQEFAKEVFDKIMETIGTKEDFWVTVKQDTPVFQAENYENGVGEELLNEQESK
ncbi:MAG: hypothetical protein ACREOB_04880 [Thermodesulfobacteriota bacterium]